MSLEFFAGTYRDGLARQEALLAELHTAREELLAGGALGLRALALRHPPTFTFGRHANAAHLIVSREFLSSHAVAVAETDRGGEVTFHGPGQLVFYPLFFLGELGVKRWVWFLEEAMIEMLSSYALLAVRKDGVPGVFVGERKLGFIGLRIRDGISTHGLSLNLGGDLEPFSWMNPCGHAALPVTSIERETGVCPAFEEAARRLMDSLSECLLARSHHEDSRVPSQRAVP